MVHEPPENPCIPSPCGQYSLCNVQQSRAVCSCLPNYLGRPPQCRPECVVNSDCSMNLACVNERCKNPCIGSCGPNAECRVASHAPYCQCLTGYTGDPFNGCVKVVAAIQRKLIKSMNRTMAVTERCTTQKTVGCGLTTHSFLYSFDLKRLSITFHTYTVISLTIILLSIYFKFSFFSLRTTF